MSEGGDGAALPPPIHDEGARRPKGYVEVAAVLLVVFVRPVVEHLLSLSQPPSSQSDVDASAPAWLLAKIPFDVGMAVILLQLLRASGCPIQPRPVVRSEWRRELLLGPALGFGLFFFVFALGFVVHRLGVAGGPTGWDRYLHSFDARVAFSIETLFAAAYEEIAYRAYLQARLSEWMPRAGPFGAVLSAGAFALAHGYSPASSLCVYFFGLLQGLAYAKWRRLPRLVVAHWTFNLLITWL